MGRLTCGDAGVDLCVSSAELKPWRAFVVHDRRRHVQSGIVGWRQTKDWRATTRKASPLLNGGYCGTGGGCMVSPAPAPCPALSNDTATKTRPSHSNAPDSYVCLPNVIYGTSFDLLNKTLSFPTSNSKRKLILTV